MDEQNQINYRHSRNFISSSTLEYTDFSRVPYNFPRLENLEHLTLAHSGINDEGLAYLKNCKKLHTLRLKQCGQITGQFLESLDLASLKNVKFKKCRQITGAIFHSLRRASSLESLSFVGSPATHSELAQLKNYPKLQSFSFI